MQPVRKIVSHQNSYTVPLEEGWPLVELRCCAAATGIVIQRCVNRARDDGGE